MISESNKYKFAEARPHFKLILEEGFKIIDENKSIINIYHSLFKRFIFSFESLNVLLKDYNINKRSREHPIAIVLRASLLDYLLVLYLVTYQAEKKLDSKFKSTYNEVIDRLVSEQIRRIINVNEKDKKYHFYNHSEHCQTVDLLKQSYSHLFDSKIPIDYNKPGKSLIYNQKDDINNKTIRKRLDSVSHRLENIRYEDAFYMYDLYSKYDHFGTASMLLESTDVNTVSTNILGSIFHICEGIGFCIDLMKEEALCQSNFGNITNELGFVRGIIYSKTY